MTDINEQQGGGGDEGQRLEEELGVVVATEPPCSMCQEYGGHTGQCPVIS